MHLTPLLMDYSDVFLDLGLVNESAHVAYEALGLLGERPSILFRLALLNLVKGETEVARVFLGRLSKDLIHGALAKRYLRLLEADPLLTTDPEIQRLRSLMVPKDYFNPSPDITLEEFLLRLLETNKQNRMAFEYLMGFYLVTRQLDKLVFNIGRLNDFDYVGIPRHYEEAILIYTSVTGRQVNLRGRRMRPETTQQFRNFNRVMSRQPPDLQPVQDALARDHGDSYCFFYAFGPHFEPTGRLERAGSTK